MDINLLKKCIGNTNSFIDVDYTRICHNHDTWYINKLAALFILKSKFKVSVPEFLSTLADRDFAHIFNQVAGYGSESCQIELRDIVLLTICLARMEHHFFVRDDEGKKELDACVERTMRTIFLEYDIRNDRACATQRKKYQITGLTRPYDQSESEETT